MQFARVSDLFNKAIHFHHKPKATDLSVAEAKPSAVGTTLVDTHDDSHAPPAFTRPDRPVLTLAIPAPDSRENEAALRLNAARTLVDHMAPRVLDQDAMGVIFAVGLLDEPGCTVQQLSSEMLNALTTSGQLDELAKVRADTMQLQTLQERVALAGTPLDKAEQQFSRAFVDGFINYASQHAAFTGRAAGDSAKPVPSVSPKKLARVREIYRLTHAAQSQMRPDITSFALGYVASNMEDADVKRLVRYLKSEPGKRATQEWAAGEEKVQEIMRGPKVQANMTKAFRMAVPADARSSDSESESASAAN